MSVASTPSHIVTNIAPTCTVAASALISGSSPSTSSPSCTASPVLTSNKTTSNPMSTSASCGSLQLSMLSSSNSEGLEHPDWINKCRDILISTERTNISSRVCHWKRIVNEKTDLTNERLNIFIPHNFLPKFEWAVSNLSKYIQFVIQWNGLKMKQIKNSPSNYDEYERKARNWLNGRRAPNYAGTLFPDMIKAAEVYASNISKQLFGANNQYSKSYHKILMYGYLHALCSVRISMNDVSKKTFLLCENSIKTNSVTSVLLQAYASDHPFAQYFPSHLKQASDYFQNKFEIDIKRFGDALRLAAGNNMSVNQINPSIPTIHPLNTTRNAAPSTTTAATTTTATATATLPVQQVQATLTINGNLNGLGNMGNFANLSNLHHNMTTIPNVATINAQLQQQQQQQQQQQRAQLTGIRPMCAGAFDAHTLHRMMSSPHGLGPIGTLHSFNAMNVNGINLAPINTLNAMAAPNCKQTTNAPLLIHSNPATNLVHSNQHNTVGTNIMANNTGNAFLSNCNHSSNHQHQHNQQSITPSQHTTHNTNSNTNGNQNTNTKNSASANVNTSPSNKANGAVLSPLSMPRPHHSTSNAATPILVAKNANLFHQLTLPQTSSSSSSSSSCSAASTASASGTCSASPPSSPLKENTNMKLPSTSNLDLNALPSTEINSKYARQPKANTNPSRQTSMRPISVQMDEKLSELALKVNGTRVPLASFLTQLVNSCNHHQIGHQHLVHRVQSLERLVQELREQDGANITSTLPQMTRVPRSRPILQNHASHHSTHSTHSAHSNSNCSASNSVETNSKFATHSAPSKVSKTPPHNTEALNEEQNKAEQDSASMDVDQAAVLLVSLRNKVPVSKNQHKRASQQQSPSSPPLKKQRVGQRNHAMFGDEHHINNQHTGNVSMNAFVSGIQQQQSRQSQS